MKLDSHLLHKLLRDKGVLRLYHANTITTALTFINQKGLMSRGAVEEKNLIQTAQYSDNDDKQYNVWNDVFLDTIDLHTYFNRNNKYGPVLFVINIDFLLSDTFDVWITKENPIYWTLLMNDSQKYFSSVDELSQKWDDHQRQKNMVTIRNEMEPILFENLEEILVDNPLRPNMKANYIHTVVNRVRTAAGLNSTISSIVKIRECSKCFCKLNYEQMNDLEFAKMYF